MQWRNTEAPGPTVQIFSIFMIIIIKVGFFQVVFRVFSPKLPGTRVPQSGVLRVPQHEAQMSAVHRGDGGTP